MREYDDLKKFAVSDILSVSGKEKTTEVIEKYWDIFIDMSLHKQVEIDELQKRIDESLHLIKVTFGQCNAESIKQILEGIDK